jgi:thioredoxin reductase (NADPH)
MRTGPEVRRRRPKSAKDVGTNVERPVLLVVDADAEARVKTEEVLRRRFGADYEIVAVADGRAALAIIEELSVRAQPLALVAADLHVADVAALDVLERARTRHRGCVRVLLVPMDENHTQISFTELGTVQSAMALGRIDQSIVKGWVTPEEWLYPQVQEALTEWTLAQRPHHVVYRIVGEPWGPRSHELRDVLARNGVPFEFIDVSSEMGHRLAEELGIDEAALPAVVRHDGTVLQNPSFTEVGAAHGVQTEPADELYDLVVVGAGPAGLAAGVYGASEGLRTAVIEREAIGGQASTSSLIRNYLGFPRGIGGAALAHRAWEQGVLFGAQFVFTQPASAIERCDDHLVVRLGDARPARTRAVILAVGVTYQRLGISSVERLVGRGVFYGAAGVDASALAGRDVYVVGGANSAGQSVLHLAKYARRVSLLVRGQSLERGMSAYLIRQILATRNIEVHLGTHITDAVGETQLVALKLDGPDGPRHVPAEALSIMIGGAPRTEWLPPEIAVDGHGFLFTGGDVSLHAWPDGRQPFPFESSWPGVFAVGDARHGSVKRVAGAVGEGSVAVGAVLQYLAAHG